MATKKRSAPADDKTADQKADEAILKRSRDGLKNQIESEEAERKLMLDDARFSDVDQWPAEIRNSREKDPNGPRPCLTSDKLQQYLTQIVNDSRRDRPGIKVRPVDDGADVKVAKVLQELTRHIEDQSDAQNAYSTAIESAAKIGLGFIRVVTDYVSPDSFDQEIKIVRVPNTFACYLADHISPDGSDAEEGWIFEEMSVSNFRSKFPKAKYSKATFETIPEGVGAFWRSEEKIVVCEYFYVEKTPCKLLYLEDGSTMYEDEWMEMPEPRPMVALDDDGKPESRETAKRSVKWCKHSGVEILEKRDWAGKYIPIIEMVGRESFFEGKRKLWGLVRPAKDSLRAYNYWLSTITEKVGLSPKAPFIIAEGQAEGHEGEWDKANVENRPYLTYKAIDVQGNAVAAPKRQEPSQVEAGMMAMLPLLERNVQTALGMFRASVGESESQQSGRAILALQRSSDNGTYHFGDNQAISIKHVGRIILDLTPKIIDTKRIIRLTGEDGAVTTALINPEQEEASYSFQGQDGKEKTSYNLSVGKYDVAVTVGPSYNTKRQEAADAMVEMMKSAPQIMATHGDLIFKSMDWPMADKFAERFKKMLPPQLQDQEEAQDPKMQLAQAMQAGQMLQQQNQELQQELQKAKAGEGPKMAQVALDQQKAQAEFAMRKQEQDAELHLQREKAMAELQLKRDIAVAELEIEKMKINAQADAEVDSAIAKITSLVQIHETRMQGAIDKGTAAQADATAANQAESSKAEMQQMHAGFLQAVQAIVDSLHAKKMVRLTRDGDGRATGAEVTVQ